MGQVDAKIVRQTNVHDILVQTPRCNAWIITVLALPIVQFLATLVGPKHLKERIRDQGSENASRHRHPRVALKLYDYPDFLERKTRNNYFDVEPMNDRRGVDMPNPHGIRRGEVCKLP
jgi:hypothetical protein